MKRHAKSRPPPLKLQVAIGFLTNAGTDPTPREAVGLSLYI